MSQLIRACRGEGSVVRLGVVGHRMDRLSDDDVSAVKTRIRGVLHHLMKTGGSDSGPLLDGGLQVVTSLAEGADRIVAREAVELGLLEAVVLPFPRVRFERDFSTPESRREFHELLGSAVSIIEPSVDPANGDDGYERASATILECADLLIAVWNGKPGRGPGGTAHTIEMAMQRGVPVIWVRSHRPYIVKVIGPPSPGAQSHVMESLSTLESAVQEASTPRRSMQPDD